jgi:hypothetical protein
LLLPFLAEKRIFFFFSANLTHAVAGPCIDIKAYRTARVLAGGWLEVCFSRGGIHSYLPRRSPRYRRSRGVGRLALACKRARSIDVAHLERERSTCSGVVDSRSILDKIVSYTQAPSPLVGGRVCTISPMRRTSTQDTRVRRATLAENFCTHSKDGRVERDG